MNEIEKLWLDTVTLDALADVFESRIIGVVNNPSSSIEDRGNAASLVYAIRDLAKKVEEDVSAIRMIVEENEF